MPTPNTKGHLNGLVAKKVKDYPRARETAEETSERLLRKYGPDEYLLCAISAYEKAEGLTSSPIPIDPPAKLVSLAQASKECGVPQQRLVVWILEGTLANVGRWEHPTRPEIAVTLVDADEVLKVRESAGRGLDEPRFMTLDEAEAVHGVPYETLRSWIRRNYLPETRLHGRVHVVEGDVIRLKKHPPPRGRPPIRG